MRPMNLPKVIAGLRKPVAMQTAISRKLAGMTTTVRPASSRLISPVACPLKQRAPHALTHTGLRAVPLGTDQEGVVGSLDRPEIQHDLSDIRSSVLLSDENATLSAKLTLAHLEFW